MHGHLLLAHPLLRHAGPADAIAVELAALDRDALLGRARIARHLLDVHPEQVAQHLAVDIGRGADAGDAEIHLRTLEQILPVLDAGAVPGMADAEILGDAAEPGEIQKIRADLLRHRHRLGDQPGIERVDHGAVGRRRGGDVAHGIQARRARHVLHDDVRLPRDVATDVARQHARIVVVATTGGKPDDDANGLALVEAFDVLRGDRRGEE